MTEKENTPAGDYLQTIIDALPYPFYIINVTDHTIALANAAACFGVITAQATCHSLTHGSSTPCDDELPCPLRIIVDTRKPVVVEHVHLGAGGESRLVEIHAFPIFDPEGRVAQIIEYSLDITERREWEIERSTLIKRLQHALEEVKRLSGLLPICASCKKIRDEQGRWNLIEEYIHDHSEADFSHTLCPDCVTKLYPGNHTR